MGFVEVIGSLSFKTVLIFRSPLTTIGNSSNLSPAPQVYTPQDEFAIEMACGGFELKADG